jgi:hypothetical protein
MAFIVKRDAPQTIFADAQSIIVTFAGQENMTLDRIYIPEQLTNLNSYPLWYRLQPYGIGYGSIWNLTLESIFDLGNYSVVATNPSDDASIIPTTGWTYVVGDGFPVVITAA